MLIVDKKCACVRKRDGTIIARCALCRSVVDPVFRARCTLSGAPLHRFQSETSKERYYHANRDAIRLRNKLAKQRKAKNERD